MVIHAYNPSTEENEARGSESKASLNYMRLCTEKKEGAKYLNSIFIRKEWNSEAFWPICIVQAFLCLSTACKSLYNVMIHISH